MKTTPVRLDADLIHRLRLLARPGQSVPGILTEILTPAIEREEAARKAPKGGR